MGQGTATPRRRHLKAPVELSDLVFAQEPVGRFQRRDPMQPQLLRQASLPGAEVALRTPARLRRLGRDHLNAEVMQGASYLGQPLRIDLAGRLRCEPEVTAPITVQGTEQTLALDHLA